MLGAGVTAWTRLVRSEFAIAGSKRWLQTKVALVAGGVSINGRGQGQNYWVHATYATASHAKAGGFRAVGSVTSVTTGLCYVYPVLANNR